MGQLIVQKYGGSSVADAEKIKNVARRVAESAPPRASRGRRGLRDGQDHRRAPRARRRDHRTPDPREMDMLLATGEQVTIGLLAMALQRLGHPALLLHRPQVGMRHRRGAHPRPHQAHHRASASTPRSTRARSRWSRASRAPPRTGDITTLGRGGSDLTGVALAAALKADVCEIFTDVDGVYTADPNVVPDARKLPRMSYDEMLEMASLGAKVLQSRSVEFAKKYSVPVHVRSTFKPDPGTLVTREDHSMEDVVVTGITHDRGQAKVSILRVPDRPGIAARVFGGARRPRTSWWT